MRTALLTFILVLSLIADAYAEPLRVATFNVNWGNRQWDAIFDVVVATDADVVALQETTPELERFLRRRLSSSHPHFHAAGGDGRYPAERFAFASRLELSDLAYSPPAGGLFGFLAATASTDAGPIRLINVHLKPFIVPRGSTITEALGRIQAVERVHAAEAKAIAAAVDADVPTVVMGDFNSISTFHAPTHLKGIGLVDAFASVHADADSHPTWRWPTRPLPLSLRIDYIFHSRHFETRESEIIAAGGSDHSPCVAELERVAGGG